MIGGPSWAIGILKLCGTGLAKPSVMLLPWLDVLSRKSREGLGGVHGNWGRP